MVDVSASLLGEDGRAARQAVARRKRGAATPTGQAGVATATRRLAEQLVPGPGEASLVAGFRERVLLVPLAARQLVVDLEAIAVGFAE